MSVLRCKVEFTASGLSLVQRSPIECGVSRCDREGLVMRRYWPTRVCCAMEKRNNNQIYIICYEEIFFE